MGRLLKFAVIPICLVCAVLCGCGGVTASSNNSGNGGTSGTISTGVASIDFGSVNVGTSATNTVTVTNTGSAAITVTQLTVTGNGFSVSGVTLPATLNPNQSASAIFKFAPITAGAATGSVAITTDTPSKNLALPMTGTGITPGTGQLTATPPSVSFGSVNVGSNNTQTVTLKNTGSASLTVNSASFSGPGFNIAGLITPLNLSVGQSSNFTASFNPSSAGSASGNVLFKDTNGTTLLSVSMSGTGVATVSHSVDLSWIASTSNVVGYRVYRGITAGGPYNLISSATVPNTIYTDSAVTSGSSYFYVVTAVDANNNESSYSNESLALIPTP